MYICPSCGAVMFKADEYVLSCPECNFSIEIEDYDDYEPEEYHVREEEDIPECCIACGGPYPDCMSSCKIFDD